MDHLKINLNLLAFLLVPNCLNNWNLWDKPWQHQVDVYEASET
jgi:hypothetical protein